LAGISDIESSVAFWQRMPCKLRRQSSIILRDKYYHYLPFVTAFADVSISGNCLLRTQG
jgi:hypothetical protein